MRVLVTGATGFIGRALVPVLQREGHTVIACARSESRARGRLGADVEIVNSTGGPAVLRSAIEQSDAIVNLAGEPIVGRRWTAARRQVLRDSRVAFTSSLVSAIAGARVKPRVLVSGSAVGYYGDRADEVLTEQSSPGHDFLAQLCQDWEAEALQARDHGLRVMLLRTGVVLGRDGGALAKMLPPFRLGAGGPVAHGRQWLPWIHLHDLVAIIARALTDERYEGPINGVAPAPVTSRAFARTLGRVLHRPAVLPVPAFALRAIFGEAAIVLLGSQRVDPAALRRLNFDFAFRTLDAALADVLGGTSVEVHRLSTPPDAHGSETGRRYLETRRPTYELRARTTIDAPVDEAFAFFSRAENLGLITPAAMQFSVAGPGPTIDEGTAVEYRMRIARVPISWRSRILGWRPGSGFVDIQESGPYRSWWHEHVFRSTGSSTVMEDRVCYAPPFGPLGRIVNRLFIAPALRSIFRYRADAIRLRFGTGNS